MYGTYVVTFEDLTESAKNRLLDAGEWHVENKECGELHREANESGVKYEDLLREKAREEIKWFDYMFTA